MRNRETVILSDLDPEFLLSDVFFHHLHEFAGVCNPFRWYVSCSLRGWHVKSVRAIGNRLRHLCLVKDGGFKRFSVFGDGPVR